MNFSSANMLLAVKQVRTKKRLCYPIFFYNIVGSVLKRKSIGPLHDPVTRYKITYTGKQVV